jgi:hypothetical protein
MATTYKVLGQLNPAATTATTLYTVPGATNTVVSTLNVANQGSSPATYRIAIRPAGATLDPKHYIAYDSTILGNNSIAITVGLTLAATDVITVYSSTATMSFNAFGSEIA